MRLLFYQLLITKTTAEEIVVKTDSNEPSYDASYEAPLTSNIGLIADCSDMADCQKCKIGHFSL